MAAKAVSALYSFLFFKEAAARQAQSKGSFTKRHNFVAFSHLPLSQKSSRIVGYDEFATVIVPPSLLLIEI